ncbi:aminopeptidase P family protein [bacterium]|nr:aminopeptidase P family protein [candidate division CSSED10-310 bacterium]
MSNPDLVSTFELSSRRQKFQNVLASRSLHAAWLVSHPNVFYLTGTAQNSSLLIHCEDEPVLFVRKYEPRARMESDISDIRPFAKMSDITASLKNDPILCQRPISVGIEMDVLPLKMFRRLETAFPGVQWHDISAELRWIRAAKSEYETGRIREAAAVLDKIFDQIAGWLKPGMMEIELAADIEGALRREGHQGYLPVHAFNSSIHFGNVLFGKSGAVRGSFDGPTCGSGLYPAVPKGAGRAVLQPGEPVFIDLVSGISGYLADATRVYCLGVLPDVLLNAHRQCIAIQNQITENLHAGIPGNQPYDTAIKLAAESGLQHVFMGPDHDRAAFVGHGVGLEIDELPVLAPHQANSVPAGSIVAIEPKAVFEMLGAVGIENTWLVTERKTTRLTHFPDECQEC